MKICYPQYYNNFKCYAGNCKNSCCVGWEIDIDETSLVKYKNQGGEIGTRMNQYIDFDSETPHFVLQENDRCPFLNDSGLCDIISELGENALCQICNDHPRFKNYFSDRIEIGLGLSCEAACDVILDAPQKFSLIEECDNIQADECDSYELALFNTRSEIFRMLQDDNYGINERFDNVFRYLECDISHLAIGELFDELEILEFNIKDLITNYVSENKIAFNCFDAYYERLAIYFIFRHLAGAVDDGRFVERVAFAYFSIIVIQIIASHLCDSNIVLPEHIKEAARIYSTEIEYSEDNTESVLSKIEYHINLHTI